ncbi:MAG: FAD-dependent oxidoreductase [Gammaproteobacteria bacterium]|nr:FAD-dependent oxidoreductase [Gammaproteobacteria bacterium]
MRNHARVVVIGGGVVGVSTLYHLAKKGWSDVVLFERHELTSGSTWHAAGLLPLFNMSYSVGQIHKYSVRLYKELEAETGQDVGIRLVGNIRLAMTPDRLDEYRQYASVAQTIGVNVEFLTPDEVMAIWPLAVEDGLLGAIRHPDDGYIQPADLTQALARGARNLGAEINQQTVVSSIDQLSSGDWRVTTNLGVTDCEHVVSATGNYARNTGALVGLDIPVLPVQHQYIVTEPHERIQSRHDAGLPEMGVLRESDGSWYMREEAGGLLLGPYEKGAPACYLNGPASESKYELFESDIDRLAPHIESAIHRVPIFGELGVKRIYNGAIAYTPDGSPIIGPAWGLRNFWLNEGHSFGITAAGGAGWQLAEWIVEGEPTIDMLGVEPRRFGDYASGAYLNEKNEEAYANVFTIHYPDEERPAARPHRTAPCYERMKDLGAVFGQKFGWERPNWFATNDIPQEDHWSFRRSRWFEHVGNECRNVMENVGVLDMTAFAKARVSGPGATSFLDGFFANRLPARDGRITLCHALNLRGGVHSEFTVMRETSDSFYLVSAGAFQRLDHDFLRRQMPSDRSVSFENLTGNVGVLVIAGPKSRQLLARVCAVDLASASFPWLTGKEGTVGLSPTKLLRVNFVGELGWELHHPIEYQNSIFDTLMAAGEDLGLAPFGIRAMDSMRIEKSYRMIGTEMSIEYAALESGLDRFIKFDKGQFNGRDSLLNWQQRGFGNEFVTLAVDGPADADALGNNPLFLDGEMIGRATSGNYGFRLEQSLALGMVEPSLAEEGRALEIDILGARYPCRVIAESPYDPRNTRLRA